MMLRIVRTGGALLGAALLSIGFWLCRTSDPQPVAAEPARTAPIVPEPGTAPAVDSSKRVVAYVYGSVPITRQEFGDYFIDLYGKDRLELFVNKRIVEMESAKKGIDVTPLEIDAAILEDCKTMKIEKKEFIGAVLKQRYHKTLDEWRYDVIKPRLLLAKLCRDRIEVSDVELKQLFENLHGEKAQVKIILWPPDQKDRALNAYDQLRQPGPKSSPDLHWDAVATKQPNSALAACSGLLDPIGRYSGPDTAKIEQIAFGLKVGDVSSLIDLPKTGYLVVKRIGTVPAEKGIDFEKVKADLRKEVADRRLNREVPMLCEAMKKAANPKLLFGNLPRPQPAPVADPGRHVVAYVYGNVPITREEYGDYFINLYGEDRLKYYVNQRIIELECARKGITVTPLEVDAAILEDCKTMKIDNKDFVSTVLKQRYHKTLEEWQIDVVKPKLMLAKLCRGQIAISDVELKEMYENRYGEKAEVKIILWPKEQREFALKSYGQLRQPGPQKNPDLHWDAVATKQPSGALAASAGRVDPIGRHSGPETAKIEEIAFGLKIGEVSALIDMQVGCLVVKRIGTIPAQNVEFEKVKAELRQNVIDRKIEREVPKMFEGMNAVARPLLLLGRQELPQPDPSLVKP